MVPYHVPLKFGLSANTTTLPDPTLEIINDAAPGIKSFLFDSEIYPSMWKSFEYIATDE